LPSHPSPLPLHDALPICNSLAAAYLDAGRTDDAIKMHESTLKLMESKLGPDHPNTLVSRNNLASAYGDAGRTDDAIKMHESTLRSEEHTSELQSLTNLVC